MRRFVCSFAVLAVATVCGSASADFKFSNVRTSFGSGSDARDRVTFFALNDGKGYSLNSHNLLAMELTAASTNVITFAPNTFDGIAADEAAGLTAPAQTIAAGTPTTTKVLSEIFTQQMFQDFQDNPRVNPNQMSFYALGADLSEAHGIDASKDAGVAFLTLVTAPGATVTLSGGIAAESGSAGGLIIQGGSLVDGTRANAITFNPFSYVAVAPEPATLAGLAAVGLIAGRRARKH